MDDQHAEQQERPSRQIGSLVTTVLSTQSVRDTTSHGSPPRQTGSGIAASERGRVTSIGERRGGPGYSVPLSLSEAMHSQDPAEVDRAVMASLPPSVASACRARWTEQIGDFGWEGEFAGYSLVGQIADRDLAAAKQALSIAMSPPAPRIIKSELARLRATTISRAAEQQDLTLTFAAYAEAFTEYPADVVIDACRYWGRNEKFWPALCELRQRMDRTVRRRKSLAAAVDVAIRQSRA